MDQNPLTLDGRVVIVTGAAGGGMGTATVELAARAGATVVAVSRSQEKIERQIAPLVAQGLPIMAHVADPLSDEGVASIMAFARRAPGKLYGLVNVAGGAGAATWMRATRVSRADWRALLNQNLESMFFMSQAVAAELQTQRRPGSIVSISSISGMNTAPYHIAYGTAKAAIVAATRTLAAELALDNIRVNCVAPGVTATPASGAYVADEPELARAAIAMGRRARPEEQANVILFLLSDMASYVTGQTILVDGGLNLRWTHLGADNTSLFLKDENFRAAMKR